MLIIFVFIKMGVAHSISHTFSHDDIADCDDCILIIDSNNTYAFDYNTDTYENNATFDVVLHKPIVLLYESPVIRVYRTTQFFNKPPPSLV